MEKVVYPWVLNGSADVIMLRTHWAPGNRMYFLQRRVLHPDGRHASNCSGDHRAGSTSNTRHWLWELTVLWVNEPGRLLTPPPDPHIPYLPLLLFSTCGFFVSFKKLQIGKEEAKQKSKSILAFTDRWISTVVTGNRFQQNAQSGIECSVDLFFGPWQAAKGCYKVTVCPQQHSITSRFKKKI